MARRAAFRSIALAAALACNVPAPAGAGEKQQIGAALAWVKPILRASCDFPKSAAAAGGHAFGIRYRDPGQDQDSPDRQLTLYQLACSERSGNTNFVFVARGEDGYGLLSFALPQLDYDYDDETFSSLASPPRLVGYRTTYQLANAVFDPKTRAISMHMKWNEGDEAWSAATWQFIDGSFVLSRFDVDPTYARHGDAAGRPPAEPQSYRIFPDKSVRKN